MPGFAGVVRGHGVFPGGCTALIRRAGERRSGLQLEAAAHGEPGAGAELQEAAQVLGGKVAHAGLAMAGAIFSVPGHTIAAQFPS